MQPDSRLLLVGCGHAHLFVLEALARGRLRGVRVTLVSAAEDYFYSGMIPGVIAGFYTPGQARFRPARLAHGAGAEWVRGQVMRVGAAERRIHLEGGATLSYDLLSLNIGSRPAGNDLPGVRAHALPLRPMERALEIREATAAAVREASPARIAVVGAGAAGTEVALCLDAALAREFGRERYGISLLEAGEQILAEHPESVRARALRLLRQREIGVRTGFEVVEVDRGEITPRGGAPFPFHLLIWAAGPRAPALPRTSGLPTDAAGYLLVEPTLQVAGHPEIFGAGDCAALQGYPWVPRAGVYAVRQGPVLVRNLARQLHDQELAAFEPQRHWLSLLNTGDGRALLSYRGFGWYGRALWWLKNRIDQRFMHRFQRLEA